jgi:ankyrin repeat protein
MTAPDKELILKVYSILSDNRKNEEVKSLIKGFYYEDFTSLDAKTLLMRSSRMGNEELTELFIKKEEDINRQDSNGRTALIHAIRKGKYNIASFLLNNGANPNIINEFRETPLMQAAQCGNIELVKILLNNQAHIHIKNIYGQTAIRLAYAYDRDEVYELLKQKHSVKNFIA